MLSNIIRKDTAPAKVLHETSNFFQITFHLVQYHEDQDLQFYLCDQNNSKYSS